MGLFFGFLAHHRVGKYGPLSLPRRGPFSCPELLPGHAHGGGDLFKRGHAGMCGQGFHLEIGLTGDAHAVRQKNERSDANVVSFEILFPSKESEADEDMEAA